MGADDGGVEFQLALGNMALGALGIGDLGQIHVVFAGGEVDVVMAASASRAIGIGHPGIGLCCAVRLGGMSANCSASQLKALTQFCYNVGLAFQVIDDILDVTQTTEKLGKTAGKDTKARKATYPAIVGLAKSRRIAQTLTERAFNSLKVFKGQAKALEAMAEFLLKRDR